MPFDHAIEVGDCLLIPAGLVELETRAPGAVGAFARAGSIIVKAGKIVRLMLKRKRVSPMSTSTSLWVRSSV